MQERAKKKMSDAYLQESARLFGVLADASRLRLLRELMEGPLTVTELVELTGLKQGNVSKHLGILLNARFLMREQQGIYARYYLRDRRVFELCKIMCARIDEALASELKSLNNRGGEG
jgi:DNA-binding transcriptional ArsR family regulator